MSDSFVSLVVRGEARLIRLDRVREVLPMVALQEVTLDHPACLGMLNLRGEVIPVYTLDPARPPLDPSQFIVVTTRDGEPLGLVVEGMGEVLEVDPERVQRRRVRDRDIEVAYVEEKVIPVLDPQDALGPHG